MRPIAVLFAAACAGVAEPPAPPPAEPPAPVIQAGFLPPPADAMPDGPFGESVRRGHQILTDTRSSPAARYVGSDLKCSNCHLDAGRKADAGPMWAAWVSYPAYRKKTGKTDTMEDRIRGCFEYSMDARHSAAGAAPPPGDAIYADVQAYQFWLATGAPTGQTLPGRGFPEVARPAAGWDVERGKAVYTSKCVACHGPDGQGIRAGEAVVYPPLWGAGSYNWGAGMHRINTAAAFIQANMPLGQGGTLTDQEAWDVAAYVNSQPRPADPRQTTLAATDAEHHDEDCRYNDVVDGVTLGEDLTR